MQNPFSLETDVIKLSSEKGNSQSRRGETGFFYPLLAYSSWERRGLKKKVKYSNGGGRTDWNRLISCSSRLSLFAANVTVATGS